jgi:hypothetical protein
MVHRYGAFYLIMIPGVVLSPRIFALATTMDSTELTGWNVGLATRAKQRWSRKLPSIILFDLKWY